MKGKPLKIIISIVGLLIIYTIFDYMNFLTFMGITPANINVDMFGYIFNAAIVLALYTVSFYYIDNKQNEKDANARKTVDVLMKESYQVCLNNLNLLDNKEMIEKYIIPKVEGNKTDKDNKVINNLQTLPFSSFDTIIDLAVDGYIENEKLDTYMYIKKEYQYLISVKIIFFDLVEP